MLVVQLVGALIGTSFLPGVWYEGLNKAFFNPPAAIFGIVWPLLYVLIAIAGWRIFVSEGDKPGWGLWVSQLVMNWAWSPVFFGLQEIAWAMVLLLAILSVSITFVATTWDRDRLASICFLPYCAWLGFALLLNFSIWLLN